MEVRGEVKDEIRDEIRGEVWDEARGAVRGEVSRGCPNGAASFDLSIRIGYMDVRRLM